MLRVKSFVFLFFVGFCIATSTLSGSKQSLSSPSFSTPSDPVEKVISTVEKAEKKELKSWSEKVSSLVATTETLWLRILLVLLLGLLMSLTPCIYPMIPITLGILQSSSSKSVAYNFLQALFYTLGIATTFAILGLLAAFTGQLFGNIMTNPAFIIILAALLVYLAGSMFGFYNMYTPKFMLNGTSKNQSKRSLLSIFLFGAISGTVASPCLSPGLILLLSIVTAIGSKILGFVLLFAFGFGLGIPLLLIGTFSSSLNALPRAGMWMIEVKKLFGFMLFGMALYFLSAIIPISIIYLSMTLFLLYFSLFYFYTIQKSQSKGTKALKNLVGVLCAILAAFFAAQTYKAIMYSSIQTTKNIWFHHPEKAFEVAKKSNKRLFIDIEGEFCSICKAIDETLFSDTSVQNTLTQKFIPLKINVSHCPKEITDSICSKYRVVGFPTYLLVDSQTGDLVARWGSELYDLSPQQFIALLKDY